LLREPDIHQALVRAVEGWALFAETYSRNSGGLQMCDGELYVRRMDVERGCLGSVPGASAVVTSTPYANRLDYTRMWAPELEVLSAMWSADSTEIKAMQIGSTVVEGKAVTSEAEAILPTPIRRVLHQIRADTDWGASESYYYP